MVALSLENTVGELMLRLRATFCLNWLRFLRMALLVMADQALPEVREGHQIWIRQPMPSGMNWRYACGCCGRWPVSNSSNLPET